MIEDTQLFQLAGFLGEDLDFEYANADAAVLDFKLRQGQQSRSALVVEMTDLLASSMSEAELEDLWLEEANGSYEPSKDGLTYREWFAHVRELLTAD